MRRGVYTREMAEPSIESIDASVLGSVDRVAQSLSNLGEGATLGIVLGSGLSRLVDGLTDARGLPFSRVDGMPVTSAPGHEGVFVRGRLAFREVLVMQGRVHPYEGHAPDATVRGVRAMRRLGVETFVLTNAAGGIRDDLEPGDLLSIEDHLNLTGLDPGVGLGDGPLGARFANLVDAWDPDLRARLLEASRRAGVALATGIYASRLGPSYETPAEVRMLKALGADAVGMSTVLEAIALRRMGARLVGISCITNRAAGRKGAVLDHEDVQKRAREASSRLLAIVRGFAEVMG